MSDVIELITDHDLKAHSCIILTYNIDLPFYDGLVRRKLRAAGIANQVVFCDYAAYQLALQGISAAENLGRSYSVTPVYRDGAFHPKIYLVLGRRNGRLVIGSGNASVGGLARNAELFGYFDFDEKKNPKPHTAFSLCSGLVESLAKKAAHPVRDQIRRAMEWSPWLRQDSLDDERSVMVGGTGAEPLFDQILKVVGKRKPKRIILCSSSFDRKLAALERIAKTWAGCRVHCIVDPKLVTLDGKQVSRVGKSVVWNEFTDPIKSKKPRQDLRLHAKLMVFEFGKEEIVLFGSGNVSRPALLSGENVEVLVALPPMPRGSAVKELGLGPSLKTKSVYLDLAKKTWQSDPRPKPPGLMVTGAAVEGARVVVLLEAPRDEQKLNLALLASPGQPNLTRAVLRHQGGQWVAEFGILPPEARIAIVTDEKGHALSHPVSLTWAEVSNIQTSQLFGAKVEAAIRSMKDGAVLGTILFELLDQVADFRVLTVPASAVGGKKRPKGDQKTDEDRPTASFYTDEVPDPSARSHTSERADLELLANLIHPLERRQLSDSGVLDEEGEIDDSLADEEAERREVDRKKGVATGAEVAVIAAATSPKALERASRKLRRRLNKAAGAAEEALFAVKDVQEISANAIARQIWMVHIAAFLAGREIQANDGTTVTCVEPTGFARFIMRICRALSGGKAGGLLHKVPSDSWEKWEGKTLSRGLRFLWTCAVWSVGHLKHYWEHHDGEPADGPHDALPLYVAARFVSTIRPFCNGPDTTDIRKRLPAWRMKGQPSFEVTSRAINDLSDLIIRLDGPGPSKDEKFNLAWGDAEPGALAYNQYLGATVVLEEKQGLRGRKITLLNLSKESAKSQYLVGHVVGIKTGSECSGCLLAKLNTA